VTEDALPPDPAGGFPPEESLEEARPALPPPSGVDLGRALLAQAKADARDQGRRTADRQALRTGDVDRQRRSSAAPDDRDPQPLGTSVDRLVAERGWAANAAVGGVVARWPVVVGPELADHCVPERYADTVLTVRAESTAWATQLRILAPMLVARLNAECGDGTVTQVKVLGPGGSAPRPGPLRVPGRGPRDTYG
jgi:predicted nucleic acid-binding Zn ribbon protein